MRSQTGRHASAEARGESRRPMMDWMSRMAQKDLLLLKKPMFRQCFTPLLRSDGYTEEKDKPAGTDSFFSPKIWEIFQATKSWQFIGKILSVKS